MNYCSPIATVMYWVIAAGESINVPDMNCASLLQPAADHSAAEIR
jgi:hypothetical protein